jgi:hypothetical protein
VLERGEGRKTAVSGGGLKARQTRASVAIDEEGAVVLLRPLRRDADPSMFFKASSKKTCSPIWKPTSPPWSDSSPTSTREDVFRTLFR